MRVLGIEVVNQVESERLGLFAFSSVFSSLPFHSFPFLSFPCTHTMGLAVTRLQPLHTLITISCLFNLFYVVTLPATILQVQWDLKYIEPTVSFTAPCPHLTVHSVPSYQPRLHSASLSPLLRTCHGFLAPYSFILFWLFQFSLCFRPDSGR